MESLFIGQKRIELNSVDSTNSYLLQLMKNTLPPEGTLVYAHVQTDGRGQRGNHWQSEPYSNLILSIVLYPNLSVGDQVYLTKAVSLGICDFLDSIIADVRIKWPNDIYAGEKKIAGILIENNLKAELVAASVIGIGLNVNQAKFDGLDRAISMKMLTGKNFDLKECMSGLCASIEARYLQLKTNKKDLLDRDYSKIAYNLPGTIAQE